MTHENNDTSHTGLHLDVNGDPLGFIDIELHQTDVRRITAQLVMNAGRDNESITNIIEKNLDGKHPETAALLQGHSLVLLTEIMGEIFGGENNPDSATTRKAYVNALLGIDGQAPTMPAWDQS